jgi:hypothetical protein
LTDPDEVSVMTRNKVLSYLVVLSALAPTLCHAGVPTPAPSITISTSNVTMPSSGTVTIPFTLTSVNGFVGSVAVDCIAPTEPVGVNAPYCEDYGPVRAYPLTADGTATGSYQVVAIPPNVVPAARAANLLRLDQGASWALAGVLMLGIGLQRKRTRRFARVLLAIGVIGLTGLGISGCGGPPTLTPGAYVFTLNANSVSPAMGPFASTTSTVTVPAGIVTKSSN